MQESGARSSGILGSSPQIQLVQKLVEQVAQTDSPVLIHGERGSGRQFAGQELHQQSARRRGRFERLGCSGWSEAVLESQLLQKLERADQGTLFLDDIDAASPPTRARLRQYIDEKRFRHVNADARIIAAHEGPPHADEALLPFGASIAIPPLRERKLDIPILVQHFVKRYAEAFGKNVRAVHPTALMRLMAHQWPGNVRELEYAVERAVLASTGESLAWTDFSFLVIDEEPRPLAFMIPGATIQEIEKEAIVRTLEHTGGSTSTAAKILNMSVRKIQYKLKQYRQQEALQDDKAKGAGAGG